MDIRSKHLSSEDRGCNENTNGLLRQFMPKGTDLNGASQTWLNDVANLMNNRPRKPSDGEHPLKPWPTKSWPSNQPLHLMFESKQPKSMRSIIDATQREQQHGSA